MDCKYTFKKYRGVMFDGTEDWYLIESRAYWHILKTAGIFSILTSRNRIINTFIIVNIIPTCKR